MLFGGVDQTGDARRIEKPAGLAPPQPRIGPAAASSRRVPSSNAPLVEHDEPVEPRDRRQPVRDRDDRAALHQPVELLLDRRLDLRIERRGGLVEHQDRRVLQDHPGERDALALAAREFDAALADMRVEAAPPVPVFEPLDKFEGMRLGARRGVTSHSLACGRP